MTFSRKAIIYKRALSALLVTIAFAGGWVLGIAPTRTPESIAAQTPAATGTLAGRVLNADGSPAVAVDVAVVPDRSGTPDRLFVGNEQRIDVTAPSSQAVAFVRADASGRFKFEGVPAGRYRLAAGVALKGECPPRAGCVGGQTFFPYVNRPTYFPANADLLTVPVTAPVNIEFRLKALQPAGFLVSGKFAGAIALPNGPTANFLFPPQVKLISTGECRLGTSLAAAQLYVQPETFITGGVASDGAFELRDVPAGSYTLCFKGFGPPSNYAAVTQVTVDKNIGSLNFPVPAVFGGN
jgi:hypothetical protein